MRFRDMVGLCIAMLAMVVGSLFMSQSGEAADAAACPVGYTLDAGGVTCSRVVDAEMTEVACPDGTSGTPGDCYVIVAKEEVASCDVGVLTNEACRIEGAAPTAGEPQCPDGYAIDAAFGGLCARFEPASQEPASCPDGAHGVAGGCYILVARLPSEASCSEGVLVSNVCVIYGDPPVPGEDTCPVSATVFEDESGCYELKTPAEVEQGCVPQGDLCRVPVPLVPGALRCADGYGLINGDCIRYEDPVGTPGDCPPNSVEDVAGDCRKPIEDQAGAYFCEDAAAALNGTSCVWTAPAMTLFCADGFDLVDDSSCVRFEDPTIALVCNDRSTETIDGQCRQPVADVQPHPYCPDAGAVLSGDTCTLTVLANLECDGLVITIDLNTNGGNGTGTAGDDVILGTSGADVIDGLGGDDTICAGAGDDIVQGGPGIDTIFGEGGADKLFGAQGHDVIRGGDGDDTIHGNRGNDVLFGEAGDDRIFGYAHDDTIDGGDGDDRLHGNFGDDVISGGAGDDRIFGYGDADVLSGGAGNDLLTGNFGDDTIDGGADDDILYGSDGDDIVGGGDGDDIVNGNSLNDTLTGGPGNDTLDGGIGTDTCNGGLGIDSATRCESITGVP